jgi:FeS assembly SUF system regulator
MLKITKLADYAVLIMKEIAAQPQNIKQINNATISQNIGITLSTVQKITKILQKSALLDSIRGPEGGYKLSQDKNQITLADIIIAIEGKPALTECTHSIDTCELSSHCKVSGHWQVINRIVFDALNNVSLVSLNQPPTQLEKV